VVRLQHYLKSQSATQEAVSATKPRIIRSHTRRGRGGRGAVDTELWDEWFYESDSREESD